jgi:surface polysaccharide O-acyltransferase-like enzyme
VEQQLQKSNLSVNLIRALAIFLVIVIHASAEQPTIYQLSYGGAWWTINFYDSLARCSIPLFIIVSGFLLLEASKLKESNHVFLKKRVLRIIPPLIFWAAIYFVWRYFVDGESISLATVYNDLLSGNEYFHFPFLYLLFGLYLITPVLRPAIASSSEKMLKYIIILSFTGVAIVSFINLFIFFNLAPSLFIFGSFVGYFVLGVYLPRLKIKPYKLIGLFIAGYIWTVVGTWVLTLKNGGQLNQFFYDYSQLNVILMTIPVFLLLSQLPPQWFEKRFSKTTNKLVNLIGQNTLAIYLFHVIVLLTLQRGLLGLKISVTTLNPILEIPLISIITLAICLAIIVPLKRVPYLKRLIG